MEVEQPLSSPLTSLSSQESESQPPPPVAAAVALPDQLEEEENLDDIPDSEGEEAAPLPSPPPADLDSHRDKRTKLSPSPLHPARQLSHSLSEPLQQPADDPTTLAIPTLSAPSTPLHPAAPPAQVSPRAESLDQSSQAQRIEVELGLGVTPSQDMASFFDTLDPNELDFLPSSDPPRPEEEVFVARRGPAVRPVPTQAGGARDPWDGDSIFPLDHDAKHDHLADDSGVFLSEDLEMDPDLVVEEAILPTMGDEMEFEGDEMWEGFEENALDDMGLGIVGAGEEAPLPPKEIERLDDEQEDYDEHYLPADPAMAAWDPNAAPTFQLGNGKPIVLSERALEKARALLADDESIEKGTTESTSAPARTAMSGFTTGGGGFVAGPSSAALSRSSAALERRAPAFHPPSTSTPTAGFTSGHGHPVAGPSTTALRTSLLATSAPPTTQGGFTSGRGAIVAPSSAALIRAKKLLGSSPPALMRPPSTRPAVTMGGSTSGSGTAVVSVSEEAMRRSNARLDEGGFGSAAGAGGGRGGWFESAGGFTPGSGAPVVLFKAALERAEKLLASSPPAPVASKSGFGGFTSGTGAKVAAPSEEALRNSGAALDRDVFAGSPAGGPAKTGTFKLAQGPAKEVVEGSHVESPTAARFATTGLMNAFRDLANDMVPSSHPSSPTRRSTVLAQPSSPRLLHSEASSPHPPPLSTTSRPALPRPNSTPFRVPAFRSPMLSHTPAPSSLRQVPESSLRPLLSSTSKPTPLKPAPAMRRLNLAMTPRARPLQAHKFSTPFKGGVRPAGLTPAGVAGGSQSAKGKGKEKEVVDRGVIDPVFDLIPKGPRMGLHAYGIRPQTHYYEHLEGLGLPDEAIGLDSVSAVSFVFDCGRGEGRALEALVSAGCDLATAPWVKNHWSLIVWKLASLVRSQPDLLAQYWCWETAVDQLKYRYEREINNAQRSCIKRIQEQDSSPAIPMVLCVSQIRWDDPPDVDTLKEGEEPVIVIVGLELTDGWYRIRANVDGTLKSACERGKIVVGSKLAISGARLESSRDGTDVLQALGRSSLIISGNSTSLAPWHAKLGFTQQRFFASLGSLTSAGGVASLMDIIVERVFPSGYVDLAKNTKHGTWNEEEERIKADEWERGRAKAQARLADEMEKTDGDWDGIIELLREAAQRTGPPPSTVASSQDSNAEEPDEILDRIESAKNKDAVVDRLSAAQVYGCLQLASENAQKDRFQAISDLEKDLETSFPPRDVRGFRVLRIRDAQSNEGRPASTRTAQLTVWDANSLGDDFLKEGQHYLISNVISKGSWKRTSAEVTLATRRDSRWQRRD